ncbi:MAG: hypothetical protein JSV62_00390 [Promethearchaeota archaeon]|nr:MAG: hypothetical protein JSV62_00390 [Candidatus Lokiarchaeota archaeon]
MAKKDLKNFRLINQTEEIIIKNSLSNITLNLFTYLEKNDYFLYIITKNIELNEQYPSIYLIPSNLKEILKAFSLQKQINSMGLYFGFLKKERFYLSLEGAEFLYKNKLISKSLQINVNSNGEKSILYGNEILKNMILKVPNSLKINDLILIFNQENELIALGKSQIDYNIYQSLGSKEIVAQNLTDKGYYLRKKQ